ncbi:tricarboxylate carrier domain-containing protein [Ditylenchus destructor]|uniref:Tricarboxylate carrier domain-containing protein n=1 Tax=Ditylenchus destructor TaxID=166010 RepID=A0AAD4NJH8_9BILA|nr:tricarboxylate carrier domain-containing protein [Ditylenchus destructor]
MAQAKEEILGFPRYPPFKLNQPRFPQETFLGRYLHYLDVIDPRTLFASESKVNESLELLNKYSLGQRPENATDENLWKAQKIRQAMFHPDTGQKIFPAFRMSGFVPFGWITVTGMLLPNPSWPTLLFWQWINQSHNACVNYANRNATKRFVPMPAVSLASTINVLCMRAPELETGIDVFEKNGKKVGTSKVAAKRAVTETTLTRAFLPVPLLLIPPCVMPFFERIKTVRHNPRVHLLVNAVVCTLSFAFSLPIALALFPQESKIERNDLEKELQANTFESILVYNKGL